MEPCRSMSRLCHLHLGRNFFDGTIPTKYSRFKSLEYLAISGNQLFGKIPPELGNLTNLKELYLGYYDTFDRGFPSEIENLSSLVRLHAVSCRLVGSIPPEIRKLQKLDTLFLQVKGLSESLPELGDLEVGEVCELGSERAVEDVGEVEVEGAREDEVGETPKHT